MRKNYYYLVEGESEEKMVNVLKTDFLYIQSGKVKVFNAITKRITKQIIMTIKMNTAIVLIFDTDVQSSSILIENIQLLSKQPAVRQVICIPQGCNLEDEIVRSCNIVQIKDLLSCKSNSDFKSNFCRSHNVYSALIKRSFDIEKFWIYHPSGAFSTIRNTSHIIKKTKNRTKK